ncbi:MAG: DUF1214 domain-containing protein [Chroococcidiopsidaceae cyanobacterium CP_BM_ER_R8_30]|nr:DUF1214 domain-containing protein [Chroococcidiopsidaceae cyanobacterium CP_BM_ER_R8_30]
MPTGYTQISSDTNSVWLLSRTAVTDQASATSLASANTLQEGYTITPPSGTYTQPTVQSEFAGIFALGQTPLFAAQLANIATAPTPTTALEVFQQLNADLSNNPLSVGSGGLSQTQLKNLISNFASISIGDGTTGLPSSSGPTIIGEQAEAAIQAALGFGFNGGGKLGNYGTNYPFRAIIARVGIAANEPQEAVYLNISTADGTALNGSNTYTITFPPGGLPPSLPNTNGFWSITAYDAQGYLILIPTIFIPLVAIRQIIWYLILMAR